MLHAGFLLGLIFNPEDGGRYIPPKRELAFNGVHGVISQKMELFKSTAVRTSNSETTFDVEFTNDLKRNLGLIQYGQEKVKGRRTM
jgi:hypothetical protein